MNEILINNFTMPVITGCDMLAASEPFYHSDRVTDFNVLIFVTEGAIYVTEEETDYEVGPGEVLFLKNGLHHYGKRQIPRGTKWYYVHFYYDESACKQEPSGDLSKIMQYMPVRETLYLPKKLNEMSGSSVENKIKALIEYYYSSDTGKSWDINRRLWEILSLIAMQNVRAEDKKSVADSICEYLSQNKGERFSAADLEKHFYLSYKHMAAVFKKEKGMSMQQYHNRLRMEEAAMLLRSTLLPVGEISLRVGFTDMLYFSRCFRSCFHVSPTQYRKASRQNY